MTENITEWHKVGSQNMKDFRYCCCCYDDNTMTMGCTLFLVTHTLNEYTDGVGTVSERLLGCCAGITERQLLQQ